VILTLLSLSIPMPLSAQSAGSGPSTREVYLWGIGPPPPDGPRLEYSVPEKLFGKVPPWNLEKDPPPLPISRAFSIAKKAVATEHPNWLGTETTTWSFYLQRVGSFDYPDRWFYAFSFHRMLKDEPLPQGEATVLVLMDGTVVKPKVVPRSTR
jgi:hypothetical protein